MNKIKIAGYAFLIALVFAVPALSPAAEVFPATVQDISASSYFPAVKEALGNAKSTITMAMYFAGFDPKAKKSPVYELAEELVNAHKRGVKVKVILDQNVSFADWEVEEKNENLFAYLKKEGIEVYYDDSITVTHAKAIVIDEEITIVGSANWTESSLKKNWEGSVLIRSKDFAREFLKSLSEIPIDCEASILEEERLPKVRVSDAFLKGVAPRMVHAKDETAFDLYLLLLRDYDGNPQGRVDIDYKYISKALGLDERFSYVSASDILREALARLDKRYKLLKRVTRHPAPPYCLLLDIPGENPFVVPRENYCALPAEYWQYGWNKRLTFAEKYFLLVNLRKTADSRTRAWTDYRQGIMEEFNMRKMTLVRGIKGLRKLNIIDVEYPQYPQEGGYAPREPVRFRLRSLYSPEALKKQKEALRERYGKERFEKALTYAEIVFKENDLQVIEDIIKKMEEYGEGAVASAFGKVSHRSPDNPKRSYKYVIGILNSKQGRFSLMLFLVSQ